MKERDIMYKKCEECGKEIKYQQAEGFYEVYPIDPQINMYACITVIAKNQDPPKDYPYQSPVKVT